MAVGNPKPMHPGRVLAEIYLREMDLNQSALAAQIGCSPGKINLIVNGKHGISPDFALALERVLGTSAEMWVNMQAAFSLAEARERLAAAPATRVGKVKSKGRAARSGVRRKKGAAS